MEKSKNSSQEIKERSKDNIQSEGIHNPSNETLMNTDQSQQPDTEETKALEPTQASQLPSERKVSRFHMRQSSNHSDSKKAPIQQEVYQYVPQHQLFHQSPNSNQGTLEIEDEEVEAAQKVHQFAQMDEVAEVLHADELLLDDSPPRLNIHNIDEITGHQLYQGGSIQNISGHMDGIRIVATNISDNSLSTIMRFQNLQASHTIIQVEAELPPYMSDNIISVRDNQITTSFDIRQTLDIANSTIHTTQEAVDTCKLCDNIKYVVSQKGRFRVQERSINNGHLPTGSSHDDFLHSSMEQHMDQLPSTRSNNNLSNLRIQQNSNDGNHSSSNGGQDTNGGFSRVSPRLDLDNLSLKDITTQNHQSQPYQRTQILLDTHSKNEDTSKSNNLRSPKTQQFEGADCFEQEYNTTRIKTKSEFFKIKEALNESSQDNTPVRNSKNQEIEKRSWDLKDTLNEPTQAHKLINRMGSEASLADIEDNMVERRLRQSSGQGAPSQNPNDQSRNLDDQEQNQIDQKDQEEFQQQQDDHSNVLNEGQPNTQMNDQENEADESSAALAEGNNEDQVSLDGEAEGGDQQSDDKESKVDDPYFYEHQQQMVAAKKQQYDQELENGYKYSSELRSDKSQRDIESPQNQSQSINDISIQINSNKAVIIKEKQKGKREPTRLESQIAFGSNMNLQELVQEQASHSPYDQLNMSQTLQTRKLEWNNDESVDPIVQTRKNRGNTLQSVHESLEFKSPRNSGLKNKANDQSPCSQSRQRQFLQNSGYQVNLETSTMNLMNNTSPSHNISKDQFQGLRPNYGEHYPNIKGRLNSDTNNEININNATIVQSSQNFNNDGDELHISISNMQQIQLIKRNNLGTDLQKQVPDSKQTRKEIVKVQETAADKGKRSDRSNNMKRKLNQNKEGQSSQFVFIVDKEGNHQRFSHDQIEIIQQHKKRLSLRLPNGRKISATQSQNNNEITSNILKDLNISSSAQIFFTNEKIESNEDDQYEASQQESKRKKSKKGKKTKKCEERKSNDQQRGGSLTSIRKPEKEETKDEDCEQIGRFIIKNSTDDKNDDERPRKSKSRSKHGVSSINQPDLLRMQNEGPFMYYRGVNMPMFNQNSLWPDKSSMMNSSPLMNSQNLQFMMMNQYMNPHQQQMFPYQSLYQSQAMKGSQNYDPLRLSATWENKSSIRPREEIAEDPRKKSGRAGIEKDSTHKRSSVEKEEEKESDSESDFQRLGQSKEEEKKSHKEELHKKKTQNIKDFLFHPEGGQNSQSRVESPLRQTQGNKTQQTPYFNSHGPTPQWQQRPPQNQEMGFSYQNSIHAQQMMSAYQLQMNSQMQMMDSLFRHQQTMFGQMLNCHQSVMQGVLMNTQSQNIGSHQVKSKQKAQDSSSESSSERASSTENLQRDGKVPKRSEYCGSKQNFRKATEEESKHSKDRMRRKNHRDQVPLTQEDSSDENNESNQGNSFVNSKGANQRSKVSKQKHHEYESKIKDLERKLQKLKRKRKA